MKRRDFLKSSVLAAVGIAAGRGRLAAQDATRKILIAGGGFDTAFIRYMAALTGVKRPKLLFLPTAAADSQSAIISWFRSCAPLDVHPLAQESFIARSRKSRSWDDVLL